MLFPVEPLYNIFPYSQNPKPSTLNPTSPKPPTTLWSKHRQSRRLSQDDAEAKVAKVQAMRPRQARGFGFRVLGRAIGILENLLGESRENGKV